MASFSSLISSASSCICSTSASSPPTKSTSKFQLPQYPSPPKSIFSPNHSRVKNPLSAARSARSPTFRAAVSATFDRYNEDMEKINSVVARSMEHSDHRMEKDLKEKWREIHGSNNWEGMIDPMLDPVLRSEILRYGEFAQACYDAFDWDIHSKYCGTCRYDSASFFEKTGISDRGYRVHRYLYAASNQRMGKFFLHSRRNRAWSSRANWMGYVAVCDDPEAIQRLGRRDIVVAWRGTVTRMEWVEDIMVALQPARLGLRDDDSIQVESGFLDLYTETEGDDSESSWPCKYSARQQILSEVKRLVELYRDEPVSITITGHSLGSALATLSAYDIAEMGLTTRPDGSKIPITVFSFSGPRVGNTRFRERCTELGLRVLRVLNVHDVVPRVPGLIVNESIADEKIQKVIAEDFLHYPWSFSHVGVELALDHKMSPFLKAQSMELADFHNLEGLLHLVDGYRGKGLEFASATGRDIALVNKSSDFLREELEIPASWRQDENKGLVRGPDGRWFLPPRSLEAHPPTIH